MSKSIITKPIRICQVPGCEGPYKARGYCVNHYHYFLRIGVLKAREIRDTYCKAPDCDRIHYANGYCTKHNLQYKRHGKILNRTRFDPNEFTIKSDICSIQLYDINMEPNAVAIVDADDFKLVKKHKWYLSKGYVATKINNEMIYLSRHLMAPVPDSMEVDHKDSNPLNNKRSNLRIARNYQNGANLSISTNNTSGFKGVHWCNTVGKWIAKVTYRSKNYYVGQFDSKIEAALAYNKKANEVHGEFAKLNIICKREVT